MSKFNAQGLANSAWAFATVNQSDARLFTALAKEAVRRMSSSDWFIWPFERGLKGFKRL